MFRLWTANSTFQLLLAKKNERHDVALYWYPSVYEEYLKSWCIDSAPITITTADERYVLLAFLR